MKVPKVRDVQVDAPASSDPVAVSPVETSRKRSLLFFVLCFIIPLVAVILIALFTNQ